MQNAMKQNFSRRTLLTGAAAGLGGIALSSILASCASTASNSGGPITLDFWEYFADADVGQMKAFNDVLSLYTGPNKINPVFVPTDKIIEKLIGSASVRRGPAIFLCDPSQVDQIVASGAVANLTPYWESFPDAKHYPDVALQSVDNSLYAVNGYMNVQGYYFNADILDEAGVSAPPESFEEMEKTLEKVAKLQKYVPFGIAANTPTSGAGASQMILSGFGWDYGKPEVGPLVETFTLFQRWWKAGYFPSDLSTWSGTSGFQQFVQGDVAFNNNGNWQLGTARSQIAFDFGVCLPRGPKGGGPFLLGECFGIGAFAEEPDAAWEALSQTYFAKASQEILVEFAGSLPIRLDTQDLPIIQEDPVLTSFAGALQTAMPFGQPAFGQKTPAVYTIYTDSWKRVLFADGDPKTEAERVVSELEALLAS